MKRVDPSAEHDLEQWVVLRNEFAGFTTCRHEALAGLVMPERHRTESNEWALYPH